MITHLELENILSENVPNIEGRKLWIWGAGNTAQLYQEGLKRLVSEGFYIEGYIDSNVSKIKKEFNQKPVIAPDEIKNIKDICVLICTIRLETIQEISFILNRLQVEWYLLDDVILKQHKKEVLKCYDAICDDVGKELYANLVMWRLTAIKPEIKVESNQYFCLSNFTEKNNDEVFIDCGAYIGDTIQSYLEKKGSNFKKIISLEPDKDNFLLLEGIVKQKQEEFLLSEDAIEIYPYGVGEKNIKAMVERYESNSGFGSKILESSIESEGNCMLISLDKFLTIPYGFLKADIESYEYQMLLGAEQGIKTYRPLLAISIYHNVVDFYTIPLLIKQMVSEYKITIRHHAEDLSETILYAWI